MPVLTDVVEAGRRRRCGPAGGGTDASTPAANRADAERTPPPRQADSVGDHAVGRRYPGRVADGRRHVRLAGDGHDRPVDAQHYRPRPGHARRASRRSRSSAGRAPTTAGAARQPSSAAPRRRRRRRGRARGRRPPPKKSAGARWPSRCRCRYCSGSICLPTPVSRPSSPSICSPSSSARAPSWSETITEHVGGVLRTYVAEAIEREIAQWRRDH